MTHPGKNPHRPHLLPAGRRWGAGVQSVLPYLTASNQARPGADGDDDSIRNPVFDQMEVKIKLPTRHH